jgi:molecular chaperone HscA
MIKDSMSYAEQDVKARMLAEQKVEAARVLESLNKRAGRRCRAVKRRGASGYRRRCRAGTRRRGRR